MVPPEPPAQDTPVPVLVVDDQPESRMALQAMLSSPEYRLVEARSGAETLKRLLEEEFAMLLLDVVMPEMNGFELATAIRERERTASVPILFITAKADDVELVYKGYRVGAVDYLVKPIAPEMLRAKVAVFAELYRQRKRIEHQAALLVEAGQKERELRLVELRLASQRHYRTLAEAVPHIVWTADPDGRVDYFNQRWFEYTGLSAKDAAGSWEAAVHPDDVSRCRDEWHEALKQGRMLENECRLRQAGSGSFRWHLCRAVPERGDTGHIVSWLGTFTDIEEQKRAQAVLAEFKGTLDAVLDAVLIFDAQDWRLEYANRGAGVLLRSSPDELLGMQPVDFLSEHDAVGFREMLAPLQEGTDAVISLETQFRRRDDGPIPVEISLQFVGIDGGRIVAIARDVTERKRAQLEREMLYQEAVAAIRVRDEFLSVASHELKTPLSSLKLQIEMLLRPRRNDPAAVPSPEQIKTRLEQAARQTERLSRLVAELMDVSRISAGRLRLELEELDLAAVARDVTGRLAEDASRAQVSIELSAGVPVAGQWDRLRVEQIITNLLTNAFKFGAGKPVQLTVEDCGPHGRLVVADHGIGVAIEDADRIFERYEQAVSSGAYGGLGLGLYIVRQIVDAHGGTVRVDSRPGAGAVFTVDLPKEPPSATAGSHPTSDMSLPSAP